MLRAFFLLFATANAFTPPARTFATFGNEHAKALIRSWSPQATAVDTGVVLIKDMSLMQRFVRARILLEDANVGCIASLSDQDDQSKLCVVRAPTLPPPALAHTLSRAPSTAASQILCRFSRSEHQLILPLWQMGIDQQKTFADLRQWHGERFPSEESCARLSGKHLEWKDDQKAWQGLSP